MRVFYHKNGKKSNKNIDNCYFYATIHTMNAEFKRNILNAIKNNTVRVTYLDGSHYTYTLYGKNNTVLMVVDCYDGYFPRISIDINGQHVGHINHLARTEKQFQNNYDISMIADRMFMKNAEQHGLVRTTMNKKQFLLSQFLTKNSIKRK